MLIAYRDACQSSVQAIWGPWIGPRCAFERRRMPGKIEASGGEFKANDELELERVE